MRHVDAITEDEDASLRGSSKLFSRPDKLRLYMTVSDPDLPGLASPSVYTKDEQTSSNVSYF
ncbi:hypothetical protein [Bradyrhizobium icense]|uniref:Uncharacterized protein n=1 Tax=Bradyrhizobium icense TaxID=1274631 RepID=A0A1B1UJ75_9BRAD|nr:hypothetical protein [Bradyrhizobium icense]ANW02848.1 hypothetical protein LMTR13_24520 [Bradyrhizobium icense]